MTVSDIYMSMRITGFAALLVPLCAVAAGPPDGVNVTVTNDSAEPVPVTGAVELDSPVTVGGEVNVANPVEIDDSTPIRVHVENPVAAEQSLRGEPVTLGTSLLTIFPGDRDVDEEIYEVPEDKVFLIEYVSADTISDADLAADLAKLQIVTSTGDELAGHDIGVMEPFGSAFTVSKQVRLYAGPGTTVRGLMRRVGSTFQINNNAFDWRLKLSGRLLDAP